MTLTSELVECTAGGADTRIGDFKSFSKAIQEVVENSSQNSYQPTTILKPLEPGQKPEEPPMSMEDIIKKMKEESK
jgi:hypothetical protein